MHEDIYFEGISKQFGISSSSLNRMFKESVGTTFTHHLNAMRVDKAKTLLRGSNHSMKKIAEMVGFTNSNSFARTFRKYAGVTPTQYKASTN